MKTLAVAALVFAYGCTTPDGYLALNKDTGQYELVQAGIPACSQVTISKEVTQARNRALECEVR